MTAPPSSRQGRIPVALQAVFLASNRGKTVNTPPPEKVASKVFFRNWLFQRQSNSDRKRSLFSLMSKRDVNEVKEQTHAEKSTSERSFSAGKSNLMDPQVYLDAMLRSRGYSTKRYDSLKTSYHNKPTAHQLASYDVFLIGLVRKHDVDQFREIMQTGINSNPCNQYGESIAHTVCRHGSKPMLDVLVERGCDFQVADDYGRTPLHDACWAVQPSFDVVEIILKADVRMLHMIDARGHCPLNYVRKEHYDKWIQFLESKKDELWPKRSVAVDGEQGPPQAALDGPNSRTLLEPSGSLPNEMARMVSSGRMTPEETRLLMPDEETQETWDDSEFDSDDDSDEDDSEYDSEDDDDDYSLDEDGFEEEMGALLSALPGIAIR